MRFLSFISFAFLCFVQPGTADEWNSSCDAELKEYCQGYQSDAGKAYCLFKRYNQLSKWCRGNRAINDLVSLPPQRLAKCKSDIETFCPTTLNESGKLARCLIDRFSNLSMDCRVGSNWGQAIAEETYIKSPEYRAKKSKKKEKKIVRRRIRKRKADLASACSFEIYFYCRENRTGGRLEACLQEHKSQVRTPCRKALSASAAFHAGRLSN